MGVYLTAYASKASVYHNSTEVTNLKLYAGHTYLVLGQVSSNASVTLVSAMIANPASEYASTFNFGDARTTGSNGGGCMTAAIISVTKDCTISLQSYGYDNTSYNLIGNLIALQLK